MRPMSRSMRLLRRRKRSTISRFEPRRKTTPYQPRQGGSYGAGKTEHEDITPWVEYFLGVLLEQAERARKLMESDQPEKLLSEKQMQIYRLFEDDKELAVADINKLMKDKIPQSTIKQALSRLVSLKLLERIGQARSTRYKKIHESR